MARRRWGPRSPARLGTLAALLVPLLAGCGGASSAAAPAATPAPVLARPAALAAYHVFVTDLATGDVAELGVRTIHVAKSVHGLGLSADGHILYVTDVSGNRLAGYALLNGALSDARGAPVGARPVHMVNTRDGRLIYVTNFDGSTVSVLDGVSWAPRGAITVPARPHSILLSPDGRWVYVACYGGAAIAVLDAAGARLAATIPLPTGAEPYGLGISRDGHYLYASDNLTGRLFVLDTTARTLLGSVEVGLHPALIARAADGTTLYVANGGSHDVGVLNLADPAHPAVRARVPVDGYPHGLALTPDGRYLIVANTIGQNLSVIDTTTLKVVATIPAEQFPNDVLVAG